jgi:hypothetical protein
MSSSVQTVVSSGNKSRIPPHQRGQELSSRLPVAVIRHILTFLPFREFMIAQKTCKVFKCDVVTWTKTRGIFDSDCLSKFFLRKQGLSEEAAVVEMRKVAGCPVVDFESLNTHRLTALLGGPNTPILSNVRTLRLHGLMVGSLDKLVNALLTQDSLKNLTSLDIPGEYDDIRMRSALQLSLLPVCSSLSNLCFAGTPCYEAEKLSQMCPSLTELSIQMYTVRVLELLQFTQLTSLKLDGTLGDLGNLKFLPRLSFLSLRERYEGHAVTDEGLEHLAQIPRLRHLVLGLRDQPDVEWANKLNLGILARSAQLSVLEVHDLDKLRKPSLLNTLPPQITDLTLGDCGLVERDFAAIGRCIGLRRLAISTFHRAGEYTDRDIAHLKGCTALTALEFAHRPFFMGGRGAEFTTQGMIGLVRELPVLQRLDLSECRLEALNTEEVEAAVLPARPALHLMHKLYWTK